jgi:DNA protecting protein DprA
MKSWKEFWSSGLTRPEHWAQTCAIYESPEEAVRAVFLARSDPHGLRVEKWADFAAATNERVRGHQEIVRILEETAPVTFVQPSAQPEWLRVRLRNSALLVWGDPECVQRAGVGVVGTRRLETPRPDLGRFVNELVGASGQLVSGGAFGVDAYAHRSALAADVPAVIAIAGGLGHAGPAPHRPDFQRIIASGGALVSTYPAWVKPAKWSFLERNKVLASLCDTVVLVRAPRRSGARSTCAHARRIGLPVQVVPRLDDERWWDGCQAELNAGARLVPALRPGGLDAGMPASVRGAVWWEGTLDELAADCGRSVESLLAWATMAELRGAAEAIIGGRFRIRRDAVDGELMPSGEE